MAGSSSRRTPNDLLRQARRARLSPSGSGLPMSRAELAEAVNAWLYARTRQVFTLDANHVGKWERGENRWPRQCYRDALRAILEVKRDAELGFFVTRCYDHPTLVTDRKACEPREASDPETTLLADGAWDPTATEDLAGFLFDQQPIGPHTAGLLARAWRVTEPPQILEVRSGRRVGERLAALVAERTDTLRRMDDFLGGGDLHDLVRRELRSTIALVRQASYAEPVGRGLLGAVGELAQLAGWVASDAGWYVTAERYYLGGVSAAHAAGDDPLAANLLSSLSYQLANVGDRREAVLLATAAAQGAGSAATATTRALLSERVAWAQARLGCPEATLRALGEVDEAYADRSPEADPIWVYWLNRDKIDVMAGRCLTELRRPERAIRLLGKAVEAYDDTHARELALYLSSTRQPQSPPGRCSCPRRSPAPGVPTGSACFAGFWPHSGVPRRSTSSTSRPRWPSVPMLVGRDSPSVLRRDDVPCGPGVVEDAANGDHGGGEVDVDGLGRV